MEENVIRVDHVYNGKMGMVHLGKTTNGITLKQTHTLNSPTLIVNKRPVSKLATFSPSHINSNGKSNTGNGQEVITTTRFSVLNTTLKPNITTKNTKYVVTKANSGGKQITIFNDDCKENNLNSKPILVAGSKELITVKSFPNSNGLKKSTTESENPNSNQNQSTEKIGLELIESEHLSSTDQKSNSDNNSSEFVEEKNDDLLLKNSVSNSETIDSSHHNKTKTGDVNNMKSEKSQPIVCNICEGEDKKFLGHAAFKSHYNENHCLQHCEICQADCFGSIGLHNHMLEKHVENKPKINPVLNLSNNITKITPIRNTVGASNVKVKLATSQNNIPLQRTMKDIRYHQEVIPKNCNPKRYKTLHRCQECKYMTYHGQNLNRHIDSFHHKRSCSYCGVICTGKKPLTDHLRLVHQVKISPEKFSEKKSNNEELSKFCHPTKKLAATLLKKSKNWDKARTVDELRNNIAWNKKISKQGKIDYNKLSAKQRILRKLRKELNFSEKDQRKRSELKSSLFYGSRDKVNDDIAPVKCPHCDIILSSKDLMCQHIESEHGVALKFRSQYHIDRSSAEEEEDDDESNDGNSNSAIHYNMQKCSKTNGIKRKRYSSESSHYGSTDDYEEEEGSNLHLDKDNTISSLYNNFFLDTEYDTFKGDESGLFQNEISKNNSVSMENIMQRALCNVMSFSSADEHSTELCFSDSENTIVLNDDDTQNNKEDNNDSSTAFAKCLPTNEDLAAWELFCDF